MPRTTIMISGHVYRKVIRFHREKFPVPEESRGGRLTYTYRCDVIEAGHMIGILARALREAREIPVSERTAEDKTLIDSLRHNLRRYTKAR